MNVPICLRAHHGLCILHFSGHGYDAVFTENMTRLTAFLQNNPETPIRLIDGPDFLCAFCPNRVENGCASGEKPLRYDRAVGNACALESGQILPWCAFSQLVQRNILVSGKLRAICGDCCWYAFCRTAAPRNSEEKPAHGPGG